MTEQQILDAAADLVAEARKERAQARRKLATAKRLLREMMIAHTADREAIEESGSYTEQVWARVERFLGA